MVSRVHPVWLVLAGILSVQLGAGMAKALFDEVSPTTLTWIRLAFSALFLAAIARPRLRGRSRSDWLVVVAFGASLATMNWAIYQAFARIPLGVAVTIEFIGPLALAIAGSRRAADLLWAALAAVGVILLGFQEGELDLLGVLFALLAGAAWAAYILLSAQTGRRWDGLSGLSAASVIAALGLLPGALAADHTAFLDTRILLIGAAVAVLSSALPYAFELVALRTIAPAVFGVLMSLEPAAAALAGLLVLGEVLSAVQWLAIVCVIAASVGATRSRGAIAEVVPN